MQYFIKMCLHNQPSLDKVCSISIFLFFNPCEMPFHVSLAHDKQNGKSGFPHLSTSLNGLSKIFYLAKPVMPITESINSRSKCHFCLFFSYIRVTQIIIAQISWNTWLIMSSEQRLGFSDISPFCKVFPPPFIVLWYRMILWQIKCDYSAFSPSYHALFRRSVLFCFYYKFRIKYLINDFSM